MLILPRRFKSQPQYAAPLDLASPVLSGVSNAIILYGDAQSWVVNRAANSQLSSLIPNPAVTGGGITDFTDIGPALEFDGTSTYLDFGTANIPTSEFTLLWGGIFDANDSPRGFIDCTNNGASGWNVYQGGGDTMYFNNSSYPAGNPSSGWTVGQFWHGALRNKFGTSCDWFRNGAKIYTGSGVAPAAPTLPLWIGRLKVGANQYIKGRFSYLYLVDKYLDDDTLSRIPANPFLVFQKPRRIFPFASAAAGVSLVGASSTQGNACSTAAITQAQDLSGANSSQANTGATAAVSQGLTLSGSASSQANAAGADAVTQAHALVGDASGQENTGSVGTVSQEHALSGAASVQANDSASGTVTQGASFVGAASDQANVSSVAAITQSHALVGVASAQGNVSSAAGVTQDHALAASGASQANEGTGGAITLGVAVNLTAAPSTQANIGGAAGISQAHILIHAPSVQDNIAASSAVVQAHILAGINCSEANACSAGAIDQTSGIPPVDGPAGSGPRLRIATGHRPAMRNTSRPGQLR
jgi:hypothetical protein